MSITVNAKTYTADRFASDSVGYIGSLKTVSVKDDIALKRTAPKPTTTFSGVGRTSAKLSRTLNLTAALTPQGDSSIEVNVVVPVGYTSADVDSLLNDFGSFVASATFKSHVKSQQINF